MKNPNKIAETERLILRRFREGDLQDLYECLSDPETVRFEPYLPMTLQETQDILRWRISSDEFIAVELKDKHKMIGNIYLGKKDFAAVEIGFLFNREYWNCGYATESCKYLIALAFSNGTHRIFAECDPENPNSWRLLEKLGFSREAYLNKNVFFWKDEKNQPIWKDTLIYSKLSENTP